jgi:hypothetical protein
VIRAEGSALPRSEVGAGPAEAVCAELWISLASLLRSYTAVHGLSGNRQAMVESNEDLIVVRHGEKSLELRRMGATVSWMRENGSSGGLELTEAGQLRTATANGVNEEEMDMAAEAWARELMREF